MTEGFPATGAPSAPADNQAAQLYERIRNDEALTQDLFRQALQDPSGTLARIAALGESWGLPVSVEAIRDHIASLDDAESKQWLVKARGGL